MFYLAPVWYLLALISLVALKPYSGFLVCLYRAPEGNLYHPSEPLQILPNTVRAPRGSMGLEQRRETAVQMRQQTRVPSLSIDEKPGGAGT